MDTQGQNLSEIFNPFFEGGFLFWDSFFGTDFHGFLASAVYPEVTRTCSRASTRSLPTVFEVFRGSRGETPLEKN